MTAVTLATVSLGEAGLAGLTERVNKLNKRAKRYGMEPLVVTVVREETVRNEDTGVDDPAYTVEIAGCAPCINGWRLAARIENNETIGTVVRVVPGKFADCDYSMYRDHDFGCDHCGTRRRRNDVFVLRDNDGHAMVVGRNCLADYLRCEDADDFARYAEFCEIVANYDNAGCADEMFRDGYGERGSRPVVALDRYLSVVSACTRRLGWTSRSEAYKDPGCTATADDAYFVIYGRGKAHTDFIRINDIAVRDDDRDLAAAAIEWAQSLGPDQTAKSEYLDTIARIATAGCTDEKLAGYAASIIRAFQRDKERAAERAEKAAGAKTKVFIGDADRKGQQDLGRVRVVRVRYIDGYYGVRTIVAMEADMPDGSVAPITWFASGERSEYEEGTEYDLRAGIKGHEDDAKWGKQTIVTRAKLTSREAVVA